MTSPCSIAELAERAGLRRLHVITWRDLDHPEAGGSELHINHLAREWSDAGLDVILRTSEVKGLAATIERDGYRVVRRGNPLSVLLRNPFAERSSGTEPGTGLVEVWHGINFLAPLWTSIPRIAIAHHVHGEQFRQVLPGPAGVVAEQMERLLYPRLYRNTPLVTLSASSRVELLELGYRPERVHIASPGIDPGFRPDPSTPISSTPTIVAVARLMPQKHVDVVIRMVARLRRSFPDLKAVIVGDGPELGALEALARDLDVLDHVEIRGRVDHADLVALYRRSWLLVSASTAEGWGMTITEAAACGTPAVATRIAGHRDAVADRVSGLLADDVDEIERHIALVLHDRGLRARLASGAIEHAAPFTWQRCAFDTLSPLAAQMQPDNGKR